jgi:sodium-dependent dicarboxylate transporter 2/3/5
MQKWNLHRRIALSIIRLVGYRPRRIVLGFMLSTGFISMWMSNTATTLMMLPIGMALLSSLRRENSEAGGKAFSNLGAALTLGIAYSASIGGIGTLVGTPPNIIFAKISHDVVPGYEVSFLKWMLAAMPFVILFLPLTWFLMVRVLFPLPAEGMEKSREVIERERAAMGRMSAGERGTLVIFIVTAILWITREGIDAGGIRIPGWAALFPKPAYITDSTVAMFMSALLFLIPVNMKKGEFLLDLDWAMRLPWDVILLLGGGFSLAQAVDSSGLGGWIGLKMQGICHLPLILTVGIISFTMIFLTEVMSNTAITTLMLPVLAGMATKVGINPLVFMIPATIGASCAFMLPSGTPPNAIVFAAGYMKLPQMAKTGFWLNILSTIILTLLMCYFVIPLLGIKVHL